MLALLDLNSLNDSLSAFLQLPSRNRKQKGRRKIKNQMFPPPSLILDCKDQGCIITVELQLEETNALQQPAFSSILFCSPGLDIKKKPNKTMFTFPFLKSTTI